MWKICLLTVGIGLGVWGLSRATVRRNVGVSEPPGYYACLPLRASAVLRPGELVELRPPRGVEEVLGSGAPSVGVAVSPSLPWIKTVRGVPGQTVCLNEDAVTIDGVLAGHRPLLVDYVLPDIAGCTILQPDEFFLMGTHPRSFDSRYVGAFDRSALTSWCAPLWTWGAP